MLKENPWMGLAPYTEPEEGKTNYQFCGRDKAIAEVSALVLDNLFITLYGCTGIGKTSLLQAGIFPYLRNRQYLPVPIRLGQLSRDEDLAEYIIKEVRRVVGDDFIETTFDDADVSSDICLWSFFASSVFKSKNGGIVYPTLVFDQFEELLIQRKDDAWRLMRQLYALLDDTMIVDEDKGQHSETNFRIVISIREDDLFRMEECIDALHLSEMQHCRYRLRQMTEEEARSVVLVPGEGVIAKADADKLADNIIKFAKGSNNRRLNTLLLSLICDLLYNEAQNDNDDEITLNHLHSLGENPLREFYLNVSRKFSRRQRDFIEDKMVDNIGRRNSVSINEFEEVFGIDNTLLSGRNRIFNKVSASSESSVVRIELMHDLLAQIIYDEKLQKRQRRTFIQRFLLNGIFDSAVIALDMFLILFMLITQNVLFGIPFYFIGVFLLTFTVMSNALRIRNDRRVEAFILPQLACSLYLFILMQSFNLYAYHIIKPSLIITISYVCLYLNVLSILLSVYSAYFNRKNIIQLKWRELFSLKHKENRFVYSALLTGFFASILVLVFTPDTKAEHLRKLAKNGDKAAMIALGNYYLDYDCDIEKAKEWYTKAGSPKAEEDFQYRMPKLTDIKSLDAIKFFMDKNLYTPQEALRNIEYYITNDGLAESYNVMRDIYLYYGKKKDADAVMRWISFLQNQNKYYGLGYEFWRGEYVEQDMERAFELYLKENNHNNVVVCYIKGWGVERDWEKAYEYIKENHCEDKINPGWLGFLELVNFVHQLIDM